MQLAGTAFRSKRNDNKSSQVGLIDFIWSRLIDKALNFGSIKTNYLEIRVTGSTAGYFQKITIDFLKQNRF